MKSFVTKKRILHILMKLWNNHIFAISSIYSWLITYKLRMIMTSASVIAIVISEFLPKVWKQKAAKKNTSYAFFFSRHLVEVWILAICLVSKWITNPKLFGVRLVFLVFVLQCLSGIYILVPQILGALEISSLFVKALRVALRWLGFKPKTQGERMLCVLLNS